MNPEEPKQYTPEEIAEMEKSRTISDAELLSGKAEYTINPETGEKRLDVTKEQFKILEDKKMQDTMSILQKIFSDIPNHESRDEKLRNVSLQTISSMIYSADKELYVTYGEYSSFRLWSDRPKIETGGHVDWGTNYNIALAEARRVNPIAVEELLKSLGAINEDSINTTSLFVIPKQ